MGAAADLFSRIFLAVVSLFIHVKARYVYLVGAVATIGARFGEINNRAFKFVEDLKFIVIFSVPKCV